MTVTEADPADVPASTPLEQWLDRLAEATGAPGGGAASAVMLALGAGLLRMVAGYTPGQDRATAAGERVAALRVRALAASDADSRASVALGAALALPTDDPDRDARLLDAALRGARSSVDIGEVGIALVGELDVLERVGNRHLDSDLAVAREAVRAGLGGALVNLRANLDLIAAHAPSVPGGAGEAAERELRDAGERIASARGSLAALS